VIDGFTWKKRSGRRKENDGFAVNNKEIILSDKNHDWSMPLQQGPYELGFDRSYITMEGIQRCPYSFFRNGYLNLPNNVTDYSNLDEPDDITMWRKGSYKMPHGKSKIVSVGEGSKEWDSTAYNMIVVNETEKFIDEHLQSNDLSKKPFFAYLPLGAAHQPHSPPYHYLDGSSVAGEYANGHMDILGEIDKVVGSLIHMLEERNIIDDTIIIFTSDNGGIPPKVSGQFGHYSSGPLRGHKGMIYEGGTRVPFTIRWGNGDIPKGETRSRVIGLNDVFATICNLVNVNIPLNQAVDSVSFANQIFDSANTAQRKSLGAWTYKPRLTQSSVRKGDYKLIHNYNSGEMILYNLKYDIGETKNIINSNKILALKLFKQLKNFGACYDKAGYFWMKEIKQKKSCKWFAQNPKRCYKYLEGWYNCRRTCGVKIKCKKKQDLDSGRLKPQKLL
jgi:hypothetical protein